MKVKEIMTSRPTCCSPLTNLKEVAQMMLERDCGEIPVVENINDLKPIGVITDRDIVCRVLAIGKNPLEMTAGECMSKPCITVNSETEVEDCCRILKEGHIRRLPVVDEQGRCCGIVSQADFATHHLKVEIGDILEQVSQRR